MPAGVCARTHVCMHARARACVRACERVCGRAWITSASEHVASVRKKTLDERAGHSRSPRLCADQKTASDDGRISLLIVTVRLNGAGSTRKSSSGAQSQMASIADAVTARSADGTHSRKIEGWLKTKTMPWR